MLNGNVSKSNKAFCKKFIHGKPAEILFDDVHCEYYKERSDKETYDRK